MPNNSKARCCRAVGVVSLASANCFLRKEDQDVRLRQDYKSRFDLD